MSPKVFVSHASEDKARFVTAFAERLRQNGVDAWLDKWEMLPGDSLVDKIFEEGLKEAQAVIVVLSQNSVAKPWVREELNAAVVKRINTGSKLIPVVIDDCEIPEVLKATLWQHIEDLDDYPKAFDRILAAIFGTTDKPPIGSPPAYAASFVQNIGALNNVDSLVLRMACEQARAKGSDLIDPNEVYFKDGEPIVPDAELRDAIAMLGQHHYVRVIPLFGGGLSPFHVTTYGFESYAEACVPGYQSIVKDVVVALVNQKLTDDVAIAAALKQPLYLIQHILKVMEDHGHLKMSKALSGPRFIYEVSPSLRRALTS